MAAALVTAIFPGRALLTLSTTTNLDSDNSDLVTLDSWISLSTLRMETSSERDFG